MKQGHPASGLEPVVAELLAGPWSPEKDFLYGTTSFAAVYAMAAHLRTVFTDRNEELVCLATEDKGLIAAAFLAALAGGPVLLLPHALSKQALTDMQTATGVSVAIGDVARELPAGMEMMCPEWDMADPAGTVPLANSGGEVLRLFTGGSTGVPRLWAKTSTNIIGEALFLAEYFAVTRSDRIVATVSPCHIYGLLYSVVLPLVTGASVVPATPAFPGEIVEAVTATEATVLVSIPAHYRALRGKPSLGPFLRLALSSAGPLDEEDNNAFCQHNPAGIVEVYGSTETGGVGLRHRGRGEKAFKPYATVACNLADQHLRIRSPYLSPDLTLDREGWFVTGDRAQAHGRDGFVLKGRADSITKVGGKRVDLEEIRTLIRAQAGVLDCAVLAVAEQGGRGHRIVALVAGQGVDAPELRRMLAARLEPHALPRRIRVVDALPMTASGKHDRRAMQELIR